MILDFIAYSAMAFFFGSVVAGLIVWGVVAVLVFLFHILTGIDYPDFITNPDVFLYIGFFIAEGLVILSFVS